MTDLVELRDKVAIEIRSLLISSPIGLTASQLKSDYLAFVGSQLPYRELGYYGVEDMAKDMPDVMRITWQSGTMVLRGVSNESTDRISSLVSRQKLSEKSKREQRRRKTGFHRDGPERYPQSQQYGSYQFNRRPPQCFVPASVRAQIGTLLKSHRNGLHLSAFESAFSKRFGMSLNFREYGFYNFLTFMKYLQDLGTFAMERTKDTDYTVYPCIQAPPLSQVYYPPYSETSQQRPASDNNLMYRQFQPLLSREPSQDEVESTQKRTPLLPTPEVPALEKPAYLLSVDDSDDSCGEDSFYDDEDEINPNLKKEIQQLLSKYEDGLLASKLTQEYQTMYQKELNCRDLGFISVIQFVGAMPDVARIERPNPSDWLLFDARLPPKEKKTKEPKKEEEKAEMSSDEFNEDFKKSLSRFILNFPNGILLNELPKVYEESHGKALGVSKSMILSMMPEYLSIVYKGNGNLMVYGIPSEDTSELVDVNSKPEPEEPVKVTPEVPLTYPKTNLPKDIVGMGAKYTAVNIEHLKPKDYVEVYVSNICSPARFWLQLRGKNTTLALEDLMEALDFYQTAEGEKYRMPESFIGVGQTCAVLFPEDSHWHRGVIVGMKDMDTVEVYYVDYGNTCTVEKSGLRFLRTNFLQLPCQAISSRLSHLKPPPKGWTSNALRRMMSIVAHKPVVALVTSQKDGILSVCLVDTSTDEDIHVNDTLVLEGYALCELNETDTVANEISPSSVPDDTSKNSVDELHVLDDIEGPRHVQPTCLTPQHMVHLISHKDKPYLISAEISAFFWETDMLRSVLRKRKLDLSRDVISIKQYPNLFKELKTFNVNGILDGGAIRPCITLYELSSVIVILDTLEHQSEALKSAITVLNDSFDPDDSYWKKPVNISQSSGSMSIPGPSGDNSTSSESLIGQLPTEELFVVLQTLKFRRKRLLTEMLNGSIGEADCVDELQLIEDKISQVRKQIENSHAKKKPTLKHPPGFTPVPDTATKQNPSKFSSPVKGTAPPVQIVTPTLSKKDDNNEQPASSMSSSAQQSLPTYEARNHPTANISGVQGTNFLPESLQTGFTPQRQNILLQSFLMSQSGGTNPPFAGLPLNQSVLSSALPQNASQDSYANLIQSILWQEEQLKRLQQQQHFPQQPVQQNNPQPSFPQMQTNQQMDQQQFLSQHYPLFNLQSQQNQLQSSLQQLSQTQAQHHQLRLLQQRLLQGNQAQQSRQLQPEVESVSQSQYFSPQSHNTSQHHAQLLPQQQLLLQQRETADQSQIDSQQQQLLLQQFREMQLAGQVQHNSRLPQVPSAVSSQLPCDNPIPGLLDDLLPLLTLSSTPNEKTQHLN